ncbi:hypothetical protein MPH_04025 [Macrophomina phaseolina MS6]|uniref:Uncharacterized protein n=1 Tax=Macrophomina phaseolina (strain MS6) TaxID=1126212 RepID=K2S8E6_MACPH|nr:hypothetical protein MPH_04025 [Macrophomina phaseolina MS6]
MSAVTPGLHLREADHPGRLSQPWLEAKFPHPKRTASGHVSALICCGNRVLGAFLSPWHPRKDITVSATSSRGTRCDIILPKYPWLGPAPNFHGAMASISVTSASMSPTFKFFPRDLTTHEHILHRCRLQAPIAALVAPRTDPLGGGSANSTKAEHH